MILSLLNNYYLKNIFTDYFFYIDIYVIYFNFNLNKVRFKAIHCI